MIKQMIFFAIVFFVTFSINVANAQVASGKKILYIPIDNRPCNLKQTVEVAEKLGYEVLTPTEELLGTGSAADNFGKPEELWTWLNDNAAGVQAAVISSDAMIYGSLIGSRQHNLSAEEILNRAEKFQQLKKNFPYLPTYVFGTIMRTPRMGAANSNLEPEYYREYGTAFFEYSALKDKQETSKLTRAEEKNLAWLDYYLPKEFQTDWFARREKNLNANKYFVDLVRSGQLEYFLVGRDDNAPFSQTNLESRHLLEYAKELGKTQLQIMDGADELGMLMISRAINHDLHEIPFVAVNYNEGKGGDIVPSYSNEKISASIDGAIFAAGGLPIPAAERADFVVAVNTDYSGKKFEAMSAKNTLNPRKGTKTFMKILNNLLEKNYPVGIIDIAFSNGADNALMEQMKNQNLQFKVKAYGGWNTATNSSGFLIGEGVLTRFMDERDIENLLLTRYFDDWIYQANVRPILSNNLNKISGEGNAMKLGDKLSATKSLADELVTDFAKKNFKLPANSSLKNISVNFTWNRIFESDITFNFDK